MDCLPAAESRLLPITREPICPKARRVESLTSLASTKLKRSWILLQPKRFQLQTGPFLSGGMCLGNGRLFCSVWLHADIVTAVVLGVVYGITNTFQPLPDDLFLYDWKEPFNLRNGWLLWAGIGLVGAIIAIALAGTALTFFNGEQPQRETDSLIRLLPLVGSSGISTACSLGITGVLAPVLVETVFRGFLMTSLTKWFPTPVSALISAAVFALAHLTPGEFPQLFVLDWRSEVP